LIKNNKYIKMLVFKKSIFKKIDEKKKIEETKYIIDYPNFEIFYKNFEDKKEIISKTQK